MERATDVGDGEPSFRIVSGGDATDAELAIAAEILRAAFPRWPGRYRLEVPDVEHLRWKLDGPGEPRGCMSIAECGGRIIGIGLHQALRLLISGKPRVGRYGTEAANHPDWQGRGIYSKRRAYTVARLDPHFDMNLGITHNPKVIHERGKRGDQPPRNAWRLLVRPYDLRGLSAADARKGRTWLRAALYTPGIRALSLANRLRYTRRGTAAPSWSIRTVRELDERADEFARRAAEPFQLIQLRDRRFLSWRYLDPRAARSTLLVAEERHELLGYVAYRTEGDEGYLIDLLALPGRLDVADTLVGAADRALEEAGVMRARAWLMLRHPYAGVLRAHGFILSRYDTGFAYRRLRMDESELEFMKRPDARIHLTAGDFDGV